MNNLSYSTILIPLQQISQSSSIYSYYPSEEDWSQFFSFLNQTVNSAAYSFSYDKHHYTPLHVAAGLKKTAICHQLLQEGHEPNDDQHELTPLILSLFAQSEEIASLLTEYGANIHHPVYEMAYNSRHSFPAWMLGISLTFKKFLKICLTKQVLNATHSHEGTNPLGWAIILQNLSVVKFFLKNHFSLLSIIVDAQAQRQYQKKCYALSHGGEEDNTDFKQKSSDWMAWEIAFTGSEEIFRVLYLSTQPQERNIIDAGSGNSLLHHAVVSNPKTVSFLIQQKMNAQVLNSNGYTPLLLAQKNEKKGFDNSNLLALKVADAGFTSAVKTACLFGHRFELKGPLFEGFYTHKLFYKSLAYSYRVYSQPFPSQVQSLVLETLSMAAEFKLDQVIQRYKDHQMVVIPTGWSNHSTSCIFWKNYFVKINLGDQSGQYPGIKFYTYLNENPSVRTPLVIQKLWNDKQKTKENTAFDQQMIDYFKKGIKDELKLSKKAWISFQQISGNCLWVSAKYTLLALEILQQLQDEELSFNVVQKASNQCLASFWKWEELDLILSLGRVEIFVSGKYSSLFDQPTVFSKIIQRSLTERQERVIQKIIEMYPDFKDWRDPETHVTLAQYADTHQMAELSNYLSKQE